MRDAAAAYHAYRRALGAGDLETIRKLCGPDRDDFSGDAKTIVKRLRAGEPSQVEVVGGVAGTDQVVLNVIGSDGGAFSASGHAGGRRWRGMVFMLNREGGWTVNREGWDRVP